MHDHKGRTCDHADVHRHSLTQQPVPDVAGPDVADSDVADPDVADFAALARYSHVHPFTQQELMFTSELPSDIVAAIEVLRPADAPPLAI